MIVSTLCVHTFKFTRYCASACMQCKHNLVASCFRLDPFDIWESNEANYLLWIECACSKIIQ